MPRFPSAEWAEAFARALNENPRYAEAAEAWEGDFLFVEEPEEGAPQGAAIHLDLWHGTCRSARFVADPASVVSEFELRGKRRDWLRLLAGELDPIRAIMDRTFRFRGNLLKAMRFSAAAQELLRTASQVPREPA
jgi:putative sterol carrier protein